MILEKFLLNSVKLKILLLILMISVGYACSSLKDPEPLVGKYSWDKWIKDSKWKIPQDSNILFENNNLIEFIKLTKNSNFKFIVFATSYCDDCMEKLPMLFSLFKQADIDTNSYILIGLDYNLEEPSGLQKKYNIESTPQLFIERNGTQPEKIDISKKDWLETMILVLNK